MTGTAPAVPQIPAGWAPFPADMNAWITSPFTFLTTKVMFRAQLQGAQALAAAGFTTVQFDTILEDPYGGWSAAGSPSQGAFTWLCPAGCSGWYEVSMTATTASQGTPPTEVGAILFVDGVGYQQAALSPGANGTASGASGSVLVPLIGGSDYVGMHIFSTNAVSTPALAGRFPTMEINWIGS